MSATNLEGVYYRDVGQWQWLKDRRRIKTIGHSILPYDLANDSVPLRSRPIGNSAMTQE